MTKKIKIAIIILIALTVIFISIIGINEIILNNKTEYSFRGTYSDGKRPVIPIPKGSRFISEYGITNILFSSSESENDIKNFYENGYFKTLKKVKRDEKTYYYDEEQKIVFLFRFPPSENITYFEFSYEEFNANYHTIIY